MPTEWPARPESKPWKKLLVRPPSPEWKIGNGHWKTSDSDMNVHVEGVISDEAIVTIWHQCGGAADFRQLAEFFNELADQIET